MAGLLIGAIPVILVGLFSFNRVSGTVIRQAEAANAQLLQQTQLRVEQNLLGIDNTVTQFINSPYLNNTLRQNFTASEFVQIEELESSLHRLQSFQFGIQDIVLANMQYGWVVSNQGYKALDEWEDADMWISLLDGQEASLWLSYQDLKERGEMPQNDSTASNSIFLLKKLPINTIQPRGLLLTSIPGYELKRYLNTTDLGNGGSTAILDSQFRLLTGGDDVEAKEAEFNRMVRDNIQSQSADEKATGSLKTEWNGIEVLVTYRKAAYNGWTYVSITPLRALLRDSNSIGIFTLLVCAANLMLAFCLSFLGSRRLYQPIRVLYENATGNTAEEGRSPGSSRWRSGDELEQIGERIVNLTRSQSEMAEKLEDQFRYLREYFVARLLQSPIPAREIRERTVKFGIVNSNRMMSVMAVEIMTLEGTRYKEEDRDLLMFAINNIAGELFDDSERLSPVLTYPYQATVFGTSALDSKAWKSAIVAHAEKFQSTILKILQLPVRIGISRPFEDLKGAYIAMGEAVNALKAQAEFDEPAVLLMEDVQPNRNPFSLLLKEQSGELLLDAIKRGDQEKALKGLDIVFMELSSEAYTAEEIRFALLRLMTVVIEGMQDQTESLKSLWNDEQTPLLEQFLKLRTILDYRHWFESELILPAIRLLEAEREVQFKSISQKVKDIIHFDFVADLTLEACAARLNYHPSYIRQVFRKETGMNFSEYLSQYRVEISKKWLEQTDMLVGEIAERLRYNNSQNFIRYFRKLEGMTPGQYREAVRKQSR